MKTTDLWQGAFGNEYHQRNGAVDWQARIPYWESAIQFTTPGTVFEFGSGPGWNLRAILTCAPNLEVYGCDVNQKAVNEARAEGLEVQLVNEHGIVGMYEPGSMDLVFTAGCLIHVAPDDLERTMRNLVDLSGRYVMAVEYHIEDGEEEVEYRGQAGALWKRNYGRLYQDMGLTLLSQGEAGGFDQCTYYLLEKPQS